MFYLPPAMNLGFDYISWWCGVQTCATMHHRASVCSQVQVVSPQVSFLDAGNKPHLKLCFDINMSFSSVDRVSAE